MKKPAKPAAPPPEEQEEEQPPEPEDAATGDEEEGNPPVPPSKPPAAAASSDPGKPPAKAGHSCHADHAELERQIRELRDGKTNVIDLEAARKGRGVAGLIFAALALVAAGGLAVWTLYKRRTARA